MLNKFLNLFRRKASSRPELENLTLPEMVITYIGFSTIERGFPRNTTVANERDLQKYITYVEKKYGGDL